MPQLEIWCEVNLWPEARRFDTGPMEIFIGQWEEHLEKHKNKLSFLIPTISDNFLLILAVVIKYIRLIGSHIGMSSLDQQKQCLASVF